MGSASMNLAKDFERASAGIYEFASPPSLAVYWPSTKTFGLVVAQSFAQSEVELCPYAHNQGVTSATFI